jgi:hypothetical protein
MKTLDQKIDSMKPGGIITISKGSNGTFCTASRSGDGKRLMFVRHTGNVSVVFKRCSF